MSNTDKTRTTSEIRAAVNQLPDGPISDADLQRVGVTSDEFDRLADDDSDRQAAAHHG